MPVQKWSEDIWVAKVATDPVLAEDLDYLNEHCADAEAAFDVVIDLAGVDHMNSSNLSQLLRLRKALVDHGKRLRLAAPPNNVWALFLATGLDKVFDFTPDTSTALAELQIGIE